MSAGRLAGEGAEGLGQAAAPLCGDFIAWLEHRARLRRLAAANQAGMTPVFAGQQLKDDAAFPVAARCQDKSRITPFHQMSYSSPSALKRSRSSTQPCRTLTNKNR